MSLLQSHPLSLFSLIFVLIFVSNLFLWSVDGGQTIYKYHPRKGQYLSERTVGPLKYSDDDEVPEDGDENTYTEKFPEPPDKPEISKLHRYSFQGEIAEVQNILFTADFNAVNEKDASGLTPLHVAAAQGHLDIVKLLLLKGAKLDMKDNKGYTPLFAAVQKKKKQMVQYLISQGADPDVVTKDGITPLFRAALDGKTELVSLLIKNRVNIHHRSPEGFSALILSAWFGHVEVVKLLVENGALLEIKDSAGDTALSKAAEKNHPNVARYLLEAGADVETTNKNGSTPLVKATLGENIHHEVATILLDFGANPNVKRKETSLAPLHVAASQAELELLIALLDNGADPNVVDQDGFTPLYAAAQTTSTEVVTALIERGAKVDQPTFAEHHVPLHTASQHGNTEIVELLLAHGANPNSKTTNQHTPLHYLTLAEDAQAAEVLLNNGAFVDSPDIDLGTPLHHAAQIGNIQLTTILIKNGASIVAQDKDSKTPFIYSIPQSLSSAPSESSPKQRMSFKETQKDKKKETAFLLPTFRIMLAPLIDWEEEDLAVWVWNVWKNETLRNEFFPGAERDLKQRFSAWRDAFLESGITGEVLIERCSKASQSKDHQNQNTNNGNNDGKNDEVVVTSDVQHLTEIAVTAQPLETHQNNHPIDARCLVEALSFYPASTPSPERKKVEEFWAQQVEQLVSSPTRHNLTSYQWFWSQVQVVKPRVLSALKTLHKTFQKEN